MLFPMLSEGDMIYLLDDKDRRFWLLLQKDMMKVQGLGVVDGSKIVGRTDGSLVRLAGRDFWAFKATVMQLMESLERGPQIITPKDAATVVFRLGLRAGDTVLEAGVGSGALTMALLSSIMPTGKVITVEVREDFAQRARRNIERAGLAPLLGPAHRGRKDHPAGHHDGRRGVGHARPLAGAGQRRPRPPPGGPLRGLRAQH